MDTNMRGAEIMETSEKQLLTRETVISRLRTSYPLLAAEYGVKRIGLFGSFARGTADESSDVDLFVELDRPLGFKFIELVEHLEQLFGRKVDVLTRAGLEAIRVGGVARSIAESVMYV
jgi:hypothetical protein